MTPLFFPTLARNENRFFYADHYPYRPVCGAVHLAAKLATPINQLWAINKFAGLSIDP